MRSDDGTENSTVAAIHTFLRSRHSDEDAGLGCFLTGRSTANQRIDEPHDVSSALDLYMRLLKEVEKLT